MVDSDKVNSRLAAVGGWLVSFLVILASKWWTLRIPASWDASWTVFAGGSTLAENGFDLVALLESAPFRDYGPGTHASSPVTWLTGLVIEVFGTGETLLPALHIVHFMIGAVALQQIYRYARGVWTPVVSMLVVVVIVLVPTLNAQFGFMYLEIPQLAAALLAINAFLRGDLGRSGAWAAIGVAVKASGIIVPLALAATILTSDRTRAGIRRAVRVSAPSLVTAFAIMVAFQPLSDDTRTVGDLLKGSLSSVVGTADVAVLLGVVLLFFAGALRSERLTDPQRVRLVFSFWLVIGFVGLYLVLPLLGFPFVLLPRYFVQVLPMVVIGAGYALRAVFGRPMQVLGAGLLVAFSLINSTGSFYLAPSLVNTIYQEHSNGYADLLLLVQDGFAELEQSKVPTVVDRNQWFRGTYPAAGYVMAPLENMERVTDFDDEGGDYAGMPPEFVVLVSEETGSELPEFVEWLEGEPAWVTEETVLARGRYEISFVQVTRVSE